MTPDIDDHDPLRVSPEEEREIFKSHPYGTFTVLVIYAILFAMLWLYFWYGLFLPAGPVR